MTNLNDYLKKSRSPRLSGETRLDEEKSGVILLPLIITPSDNPGFILKVG